MLRYLILITLYICITLDTYAQFRFKDEATWKYAYSMIEQARLGNCTVAHTMLDSLRQSPDFKHAGSYLAIAKCLQKEGKTEEAEALIARASAENIVKRINDEDSISHPELKERFLLMYMEDQGSWAVKGHFVIDSEVKKNIEHAYDDYDHLVSMVRKLPNRILHDLHVAELEEIIAEHGFPDAGMIGHTAMNGVKLVILHSSLEILQRYEKDFMKHFGMKRMAYLIDKKKVAIDEKQVYGTQGYTDPQGKLAFYPIENESEVNTRRMEAGMEPIEVYARILGMKNYAVPSK